VSNVVLIQSSNSVFNHLWGIDNIYFGEVVCQVNHEFRCQWLNPEWYHITVVQENDVTF